MDQKALIDQFEAGGGKRLEGLKIYDVAPTVLTMLGQPAPEGIRGKVIDL